MKSQYIFEPSDFEGAGQIVIRQSASPKCTDIGFMASVTYKIGWMTGDKRNHYCMVSMQDGMVIDYQNKEKLCDHLNNDSEGYRPISEKELLAVIQYCGNRFRP